MGTEHGTRTSYVRGCRCDDCRRANRDYARERDRHLRRVVYGIERPVQADVDADETRRHIDFLRRNGIGLRTISAVTGISRTALALIACGHRTRILRSTANRVLAMPNVHRPGATLIDATRTWQLVEALLSAGWSKARISEAIGQGGRSLQLGAERVTVRTERRLEQLVAQEARRG